MKPAVFWLHYNKFGASRLAKDVWTIHTSKKCIPCRSVEVRVTVHTVYKGDSARQPRAYLKGIGTPRHLGHNKWVIE